MRLFIKLTIALAIIVIGFSFQKNGNTGNVKPIVSAKIDSIEKINWKEADEKPTFQICTSIKINNPSSDTLYYMYSLCGRSCTCDNKEIEENCCSCDTNGIIAEEIDPGKSLTFKEYLSTAKEPQDLEIKTLRLGVMIVTQNDINKKEYPSYFVAFRKAINDPNKTFWSNELKIK